MGFFNKLFKQENNPVSTGEKLSKIDLEPCKTEQELIQRFGGIALDKQSDLSEVIGSNNWNVDMTKGEISFGTNHQVALKNYLNAKGYHVAENGNHLSAEKDGNRIVAEFDEQFRLTKLNG